MSPLSVIPPLSGESIQTSLRLSAFGGSVRGNLNQHHCIKTVILFYICIQYEDMKQLRGSKIKRFNKIIRKELLPTREIVIVLFGVDYQANLGIIFRLADAIGAKKLYLTGGSIAPSGHVFERVSRYKERVIEWEYDQDIEKVVSKLKDEGFEIVGVEITEDSIRFDKCNWGQKTALVLGNEGHGLPDKVLNLCDKAVFIPMLGSGGSLNVGVAAAIVGYSVLLN